MSVILEADILPLWLRVQTCSTRVVVICSDKYVPTVVVILKGVFLSFVSYNLFLRCEK